MTSHARAFVGLIDGSPAAFVAVQHFPQQQLGLTFREHRVVALPDFQGVGIGSRMSDAVAAMMVGATGRPYYSLTSRSALLPHRLKSASWRTPCRRATSNGSTGLDASGQRSTSRGRLTSASEYVGPAAERGGRTLRIHRFTERDQAGSTR